MRQTRTILGIVGGIAAGCLLPLENPFGTSASATSSPPAKARQDQARRARKNELLAVLLDYNDRERLAVQSATNLSELLAALRESSSFGSDDAARIVDMDPVAAMDQLLANPSTRYDWCELVAAEWARRDPEKAIRYLRSRSSYRADDCLYQALVEVYPTHPELVAEVFRSKSRRWQERNLEDFFKRKFQSRKPGAPPEPDPFEPNDPFADDGGYWVAIPITNDLIDSLADDNLREKARGYMNQPIDSSATSAPQPEKKPATLDLERFDPADSDQRNLLLEKLRYKDEKTISAIAEKGSYQLRAEAIQLLTGEFPYDPKSWPQALADLEKHMDQLGVIPPYPPSHFEMGPFLKGPAAGDWILRQPLALQRAWAPTFTETWAESEPEAALAWAAKLPESAKRDVSFQTGVIVWAHGEPQSAATYVENLQSGPLREDAISNTAAAWACTDKAGAKVWLDSLPDSPGKTRALERVR